MTPASCPFGPWEVEIMCNNDERQVFAYDNDLWILFNPWLKEDLVHMPDPHLLNEYVLADVGKIFVGPHGFCRGRQWVFGQFDTAVLPACVLMMDRAGVLHQKYVTLWIYDGRETRVNYTVVTVRTCLSSFL